MKQPTPPRLHLQMPSHPHASARRAALPRRAIVTALAAGLAGLTGPVVAQPDVAAFPSKTITLVVPAAPGGTTDLAARMLAEPLGKALGQTVVVDNKAGASGTLAAVAVKRAEPDGYTLLMQYSGFHTISPHLTRAPQWEARDFRPVANVLSAPQLVVVRDSVPARTLAELVALARKEPGRLTYASSGNGSLQHATGAMLEQQAGISLVHVPYKGTGPALQDLLGGQVDMTFGTPPPFMPFVQQGKLRALAVTGKTRLASLPQVPTVGEAGMPQLDASSWFAVFAPARTPQAVVDRLSAEIARIVADPAFRQRAAEQGATADYLGPRQLGDMAGSELERWGQVVKAARLQAD